MLKTQKVQKNHKGDGSRQQSFRAGGSAGVDSAVPGKGSFRTGHKAGSGAERRQNGRRHSISGTCA